MELAGQGEKIWCKQECHHYVRYDHDGKAENQEEKLPSQICYQITKFSGVRMMNRTERRKLIKLREDTTGGKVKSS